MAKNTEPALTGQKPRGRPLTAFRVVFGVVKTLAIVGGLVLTVFSLMSLVGLLTGNFWARLVPAVIVAVGAPLVLVERLLPAEDQKRAKGMPSDVLSLVWLGFALLYVGLAQPLTRGPLVAEADRFAAAGARWAAVPAYWIVGASPAERPLAAGPVASAPDAGPAEGGTADAAPADAGAEPAAADAGRGPDAAVRDAAPDAAVGATKAPVEAAPSALSPSEIFRKAAPSVVTISVLGPFGAGGGTGFFIDAEGTLVTNHHVIDGATAVGVKLFDGGWVEQTELLVQDPEVDLALLRVKARSTFPPLRLSDADAVEVGEPVVCIGNPLGLEHTLTDGLVSARRMWKGRRMVQVSAPVSPGNSGGPVIDSRGEVIGVATLQIGSLLERAQNLNLAVPSTAIKALLRDEYPDRRRLEPTDTSGPNRW